VFPGNEEKQRLFADAMYRVLCSEKLGDRLRAADEVKALSDDGSKA